MSRVRNFVFTYNNYGPSDEFRIQNWCTANAKYAIYGRECGANGTPHLQGYIELPKKWSFKPLKAGLGSAIHIEKRMGTAQQASDYCKKEDPAPFVHGVISKPGKRTDIQAFVEAVKEGGNFIELATDFPAQSAKYYKFADRLRFEVKKQDRKFEPLDVQVYWGDAGTGKTRKAHELSPDLYTVCHAPGRPLWFDGYDGEEAILIDDFYGGAIKYPELLRLLDGYKYQIPIKGGFTWKQWKKVYITSNKDPRDWYPEGLSDALARRITKITHFSNTH